MNQLPNKTNMSILTTVNDLKAMKKFVGALVLFTTCNLHAQEKKETAKDTIIKTEVVKVVTSYVPKITDAFKIKQKPAVNHTKDTEKKKLEYQIFSVPVASTFIPKSGAMKKIDLGKRERLYPNYLSIGFGNNVTPSVEGFFRRDLSYDSELGVHANFLMSLDPVANTRLSSTYYNMDLDVYYQQTERYFTWQAGMDLERNKYNWYGLPGAITFRDRVIDAIEPEQIYGKYKIFGSIDFDDSYIDKAKASVSLFADSFSSSEFDISTDADFLFPLDNIHRELNDLKLNGSINFIGGKFANAYESQQSIQYSFLTLGLHPTYHFQLRDLKIKLGAKAYFSMDLQNSVNNFLAYPDVEVSYPVVKDFVDVYLGADGDLAVNSYQNFATENPFVSPSLYLTQTNTKYSGFGGIRGKLGQQFSYNTKVSYSDVEDQPFYTLNYSKSDGSKTTGNNGFFLSGYEFGNSFRVVYNDVKILSIFGEVAFEGIQNLNLGTSIEYNQYTLNNQLHPWNTPNLKAEVFGEYKLEKWYAGANIFFVGERKGVSYAGTNPSPFSTVTLKSYIDVNLHGGYQFHDDFSLFVNLKNVLSNDYQRYTNFRVQGFQAMAGLTWKFDTLF